MVDAQSVQVELHYISVGVRSPSPWPNPAVHAACMASVRSATWSFERMLETWLRTVLGLKTRRAAMSALDLRWAIRVRISYSRSISSGKNCAGPLFAVGRVLPK